MASRRLRDECETADVLRWNDPLIERTGEARPFSASLPGSRRSGSMSASDGTRGLPGTCPDRPKLPPGRGPADELAQRIARGSCADYASYVPLSSDTCGLPSAGERHELVMAQRLPSRGEPVELVIAERVPAALL